MKDSALFIATASWEPRFLEGSRRILNEDECSDVLCFWFEEYETRTADVRQNFENEFSRFAPKLEKLRLSPLSDSNGVKSPQTGLWRQIFDAFSPRLERVDRFVFDITTTPREALWIILDLLTEARIPGVLIYHRPESHGSWCGGEPERPHIVPKLGGISELDNPTKLLIVSGFDQDRSEQFISHYEPEQTIIILQEGADSESEKNQKPHIHRFSGRQGVQLLAMDSYSADWGFDYLYGVAAPFAKNSNLILASVGPKTSAVSLYRVHRRITPSALVYSPCREYNADYSAGIGDTFRLDWSNISQTVTDNI